MLYYKRKVALLLNNSKNRHKKPPTRSRRIENVDAFCYVSSVFFFSVSCNSRTIVSKGNNLYRILQRFRRVSVFCTFDAYLEERRHFTVTQVHVHVRTHLSAYSSFICNSIVPQRGEMTVPGCKQDML